MISGALIDLGGVVTIGDRLMPGAADAIAALRQAGIIVRFITNTTRQPVGKLVAALRGLGLPVSQDEVFAPASLARAYLKQHRLTPLLLIHPALMEDFDPPGTGEANAVVVGDAAEGFGYDNLNQIFRRLVAGAEFLALARNRSFRDADGKLSLDAGPFVAALEYATGQDAVVFGKPSPTFFREALASMACDPETVVMIGDDVEADVGAAMDLGLPGVLVQTGKYEPGDEHKVAKPPTAVLADFAAAVDWIVADRR